MYIRYVINYNKVYIDAYIYNIYMYVYVYIYSLLKMPSGSQCQSRLVSWTKLHDHSGCRCVGLSGKLLVNSLAVSNAI